LTEFKLSFQIPVLLRVCALLTSGFSGIAQNFTATSDPDPEDDNMTNNPIDFVIAGLEALC
jgi:hypothetical protein